MHYTKVNKFNGVLNELKRRYRETDSNSVRTHLEGFMSKRHCQTCSGRRLRIEALSVKVGEKNIHELSSMNVRENFDFFTNYEIDLGL